MPSRLPFFILPIILLALLSGLWVGLVRLGWTSLATPLLGPLLHGPLMVSGFLGTLIALERAVALQVGWGFASPIFSGIAAAVLLAGGNGTFAAALFTLAAALFLLVNGAILRQQTTLFTFTLLLGGVTWLVGNGLWLLGRPFYQLVLWWGCFLVLTIAGERLELSRVRKLNRLAHQLFGGVLLLLAVGLGLMGIHYAAAMHLTGIGLFALAGWLAYYDIARFTVRKEGLTRYIALCLLLGYLWLAVAGGLAAIGGGVMAGLWYDALLHALFVGFVFSMIFGHAPIILPSLTGLQVHFSRRFYLPLALLHLSLLLRVVGNLTVWIAGRQWGGMLNAVAILLFLGNIIWTVTATRPGKTAL